MSAILAIVCWGAVALAVLAGLLWDHVENARDALRAARRSVEDTQPVPRVETFRPMMRPSVAAPRPGAVDEIALLERWFNAPCAPNPRRLV